MKPVKVILSFAAAGLMGLAPAGAQTYDSVFDKAYDSKVEFLNEAASHVYYGSVRPVWKDADTFIYSTQEPDGKKFYEVSISAGTKTASTEEAMKALLDRQRPGYVDPSDENLYQTRKAKPIVSPDGTKELVFREFNIWVKEGDNLSQLTFDGAETNPYYHAQWSPDSKKVAAYRKEEMKERQIILRTSRPADRVQPTYRYLDYAKPGDELPQITPSLYDVEKMAQVPFCTAAYSNQYFLVPGQWSPDSKYFTFEYNQRGHQLYQLVAVDARTGENRIIAEEKSNTFVYYYDLWRYYFEDGRRILWISERDDWRHLYMIDAVDGTIRQVTKGQWNVREIFNVDEETGTVLMYVNGLNAAKGEDPYNKHLVKLDLASGKITDLTPENAMHNVDFNSDYTCFVDNYSRPDVPYVSIVRSAADGSKIMDIQKQDITGLVERGYVAPIVFKAKARDGKTDIWGNIYLPFNFDSKKKYPVVEYIYAGPHDSYVEKNFYPTLRFSKLMEMGFVVVTIDAMGTDNRSKSFQDVCWRNLKDAGFPDRILWMQAAAKKYKFMDISNVGIYGYSAGGQNTLAALLFHPEFYKVGVALCGCHDNRMDKIWWNEQWMGYPIGPWYSENSNVDNAHLLQGKLFLINGEIDDNVDPASTLQVVHELVKNNKYFEQMFLPNHTHNLGSDYVTKRIYEFFWKNIKK
ncbi:MAG: DPP IV N-terminal domain-containing protein [Candidatus Cryptobacteroides sp.]